MTPDRPTAPPPYRPKGVVMLLSGYYPYIGGAEGQARAVAAELQRRGIPVWVATRSRPGLADEELVDHIVVHRLAAWGPGPVAAAVFMLSSLLHLVSRKDDYDVIHVHLASAHAVAAALAARLLGKRVVIKLAGGKGFGEVAVSQRSALGRLKLWALGRLKPRLAAPNPHILHELTSTALAGLPATVIPNGVDLRRFKPPAPEEKAALRRGLGWTERFALLSASRLDDDKGVAGLLFEFLTVWAATEHEGVRLYLAGTGPREEALKQHARETKARVTFLGARHDIDTLFKAADAFLLPSRAEGMSNALLEAMACGLPVLATKVSGVEELVQNEVDGLLYTPGDFEGLRETLDHLILDPGEAQKLGQAAREKVQAYSLEKTVDQWLELYRMT